MLPHFEGLLSIFDDRLSGRVPCCNPTRPAIESLRGPERDPRYLQALTSARMIRLKEVAGAFLPRAKARRQGRLGDRPSQRAFALAQIGAIS